MVSNDEENLQIQRLIADAMEDARDGPLDPQRLESIRTLLATSPEARKYYLQFNELVYSVTSDNIVPTSAEAVPHVSQSHGRAGKTSPGIQTHRQRNWSISVAVLATAAAATMAILLAVRSHHRQQPVPSSRIIATLEHINGNVGIATAGAETTTAEPGAGIRSGDTVRSQGSLSSAVLAYPDGTRIALVGNSSLTASDDGRKCIVFHGGTMFGSVVSQPAGRALLVVTPGDKVQVLGTRFSLDATTVQTDLCVSEGHVLLTRLQDGKSVQVPAGRRVVSNAASKLTVEAIPNTPDKWSEDFEDGLPKDWEIGKFVADELPTGSNGAVRAVRDASTSGGTIAIGTQSRWTHGLFAVHEDTHLHFTLAMQDPGWFNILILTRTADGDPPTFAGNYIFDGPVWSAQPGQWGTVTIPLSKFRPLPPSREKFENAVPFQVLFSSPDKDRGLVIDRIWVTRGGPGNVAIKKLDETEDEDTD